MNRRENKREYKMSDFSIMPVGDVWNISDAKTGQFYHYANSRSEAIALTKQVFLRDSSEIVKRSRPKKPKREMTTRFKNLK